MHLKATLLAPVALAVVAVADHQARNVEPCAQITKFVEDAQKSKSTPSVPHDLAHRCLMTMPFDSSRAKTFLGQARKYLEFQSTVDILKNPPSGYEMPSTDLLGGLDSILDKVNAGGYSSQFEMDLEVSHLIKSAHDEHLVFSLCSQSIFNSVIDLPLVSISTDGLSLPEVYTLNDAKLQKSGSNNISPLKSINGTDAAKFLGSYASNQTLHDQDAQYNRIFPALARSVTNSPIGPNGMWISTADWSEGSQIDVKYKNGTSQTIERRASPKEKFFSYQNGTQLYEINCLPRSLNSAASTNAGAEKAAGITGLPETSWRNSANSIAGYYSKLTGLEDTAIIFLPTFSSNPGEIAQIAIDFVNDATANGKKNMIIDVTANPGGYLGVGLNLFKILFPEVEPYTATRFRAHDAAKYLTQAYSQDTTSDSSNIFAYKQMVAPDQKSGFKSWQDLYGPHEILGSSSSSLLANFNYTSSSNENNPINGYGGIPLNPKKAPFSAKDIAIITDGDCVSTCAFFVKLMKRQGVRTVAFGGRPQEAPMQGVGGVKGGQSLGINYINGYIQEANTLIFKAAKTSSPLLTQDEWKKFNASSPNPGSSFSWSGNVNLRNEYGPDDDKTPLQFVYEAAECRLFYTIDNYLQQETVWQAAAKAMFGDGKCAKGSTKGKGSLEAS
ncbi:Interphotoreceptor retinol-binding [Penicillium capsulatum]|uniref:Interphotoreceptor retinol-binding n=1 Tax=Penicillium capsulatum TaxID=69766 RepID=A0A9W9ILL5_9EURO|nr:Interphotoreceptor retinol-binding [Penicillium capsulatum]KAJ6122140.1 Interphotoreceptor retinol-binding [Penicillium capsulatum]